MAIIPLFNPAPSSLSLPYLMSPTPLSFNSVHIALQYISPPSQLDGPLPPYLLSKELLQRHHFLSVSPENPAEYLCWPSDTSARAIHLLELRQYTNDDVPPSYPIHYTSDSESTYAHVALPPAGPDGEAVRLVFQWDIEGWKFHDTRLMPFPAGSSASLDGMLAAAGSQSSTTSSPASSASPPYNPYGSNNDDSNSDDDDYWNAYGASDSDSPRVALQFSKEDLNDSEDAYWARYSSVQGTADSTIPSPPVVRRKSAQSFADMALDPDEPLPVPVRTDSDAPDVLSVPNIRLLQPHHNPRWDPASPQALARLLADISPRHSPVQSSALIPDFEDELELSPPLTGSDVLDTPSPPDVSGLIGEQPEVENVLSHIVSEVTPQGNSLPVSDGSEPLKQSLRGLYTLWKMSRSQKGSLTDVEDRESFMRIVEDAIRV